jgi:hypothetical protein
MVILNNHITNYRSSTIIFNKTLFFNKKLVKFTVAIAEMYPQIPWEQVTDPLGTMELSLGTTALKNKKLSSLYDMLVMYYISSTSPAACTARKKYNFLSITGTERLIKMKTLFKTKGHKE